MHSIACLYCKGCDLNWSGFESDLISHKMVLPTYPFEREYCWFKREVTDEGDRATDTISSANKADDRGPFVGSDASLLLTTKKHGAASLIDFGLIFFSSDEASSGLRSGTSPDSTGLAG